MAVALAQGLSSYSVGEILVGNSSSCVPVSKRVDVVLNRLGSYAGAFCDWDNRFGTRFNVLMDALAQRLQDVEVAKNWNPINGMLHEPVVPLADAVGATMSDPDMAAVTDLHEMNVHVVTAASFARTHRSQHPADPLSEEDIAVIQLYTQQTPLYPIMNTRLRSLDREVLKPFRPYIKLLLVALAKLPKRSCTVYRGVREDLSAHFNGPPGEERMWWQFSSATSRLDVLRSPQFFGPQGRRTLFTIEAVAAIDISAYSALPEAELLLPPHTHVEVMGTLPWGTGATIVQLRAQPAPLDADFFRAAFAGQDARGFLEPPFELPMDLRQMPKLAGYLLVPQLNVLDYFADLWSLQMGRDQGHI
eukprot:m.192030 g.192030  ORF g.192030 m.192030 type:complete len:361 (-) comp10053_c0_seq14:1171-2253(-)